MELAAPPARAGGTSRRGGTRCGHPHCPMPREATRRPAPQAGGRQAGPRTLALGASCTGHVFSERLTGCAPEARCGSQVAITRTRITATVPGSAAAAAAPSPAFSHGSYAQPGDPGPARQGFKPETVHSASGGGGGGVDARVGNTASPRASSERSGCASFPRGTAESSATLRPPGTEVATRRGPFLRTRKRAHPALCTPRYRQKCFKSTQYEKIQNKMKSV